MSKKYYFSFYFWRKVWQLLNPLEKKIIRGALIILIASLLVIFLKWYFLSSKLVAQPGGILKEGYFLQPTTLNPILIQNETDQSLVNLVFNGLLKSDGQGGYSFDLAEKIEKSENGQEWIVRLRKNVYWHDGEPFKADDVVFTIEAIQNPETRSPFYNTWQGVEVKKFDDYTVIFRLKNPYAFFEENLKQKIIPRHIFGSIPLSNLYLSDYNFQPIGTGPYIFEKLEKNKSGFITAYYFKANPRYFTSPPYIKKIVIKFYPSETEAFNAFNRGQIDLLSGLNIKRLEQIDRNYRLISFLLPRYYAIFFNSQINKIFTDRNLRYALSYATDKKEIINKVFHGQALEIDGPLLPGMIGYLAELKSEFSLEKAQEFLEKSGWKDENQDGILEKKFSKDQEPLALRFSLVVPDSDYLKETAELLKKQWRKIGAEVEIKIVSLNELQNFYLPSRIYETLLLGNMINQKPDLFSFWHSSQKFHPGLNLALYENSLVDKILEEIRQTLNEDKQKESFKKIQSLIFADRPAIFLFNPFYLSIAKPSLHLPTIKKLNFVGERYFNIENWYLKTKRVFQ